MALKYDFDMHSVFGEAVFADPKIGAMLKQTGFSADMPANKVALFRDQRTVDALRAAPDHLRKLLLDSGFGLNRYDSGAPEGYYPARDEAARNHVLAQLAENAKTMQPDRAGPVHPLPGEFDLGDFMVYLASAKPLGSGRGGASRMASAEAHESPLAKQMGFLVAFFLVIAAAAFFYR